MSQSWLFTQLLLDQRPKSLTLNEKDRLVYLEAGTKYDANLILQEHLKGKEPREYPQAKVKWLYAILRKSRALLDQALATKYGPGDSGTTNAKCRELSPKDQVRRNSLSIVEKTLAIFCEYQSLKYADAASLSTLSSRLWDLYSHCGSVDINQLERNGLGPMKDFVRKCMTFGMEWPAVSARNDVTKYLEFALMNTFDGNASFFMTAVKSLRETAGALGEEKDSVMELVFKLLSVHLSGTV